MVSTRPYCGVILVLLNPLPQRQNRTKSLLSCRQSTWWRYYNWNSFTNLGVFLCRQLNEPFHDLFICFNYYPISLSNTWDSVTFRCPNVHKIHVQCCSLVCPAYYSGCQSRYKPNGWPNFFQGPSRTKTERNIQTYSHLTYKFARTELAGCWSLFAQEAIWLLLFYVVLLYSSSSYL